MNPDFLVTETVYWGCALAFVALIVLMGLHRRTSRTTAPRMIHSQMRLAPDPLDDAGELLAGVRYRGGGAISHSLVMRARSGTIRAVTSEHQLWKLRAYSSVNFDSAD